ncbi:hypothetical protein Cadr_000001410 [Camelus dromedarius]|uniref:Uncharacterized protein n=1 Tax=Camelus dromedarius TaxID=9838 RepID=A0A5N4EG58_CAMDR|nr:hypothetical protein Cadr_000001410 [Camelus dromedarius]
MGTVSREGQLANQRPGRPGSEVRALGMMVRQGSAKGPHHSRGGAEIDPDVLSHFPRSPELGKLPFRRRIVRIKEPSFSGGKSLVNCTHILTDNSDNADSP